MKTYIFNLEKETKNTKRYVESGSSDIGSLYLKKHVAAQLGNPTAITVTIERRELKCQEN